VVTPDRRRTRRRTIRSSASISVFAASLAALAVGLFASGASAAEMDQTPVPVVQLGPIRFGMTLAEIQAAVPGASWQVTSKSKFTDRPFVVVAKDALDYGGWRMKVEARQEKYDRHVEFSSRQTVADAAACEQAGLALFAELERGAGTLQAGRISYGEAVSFGSGSTALFTAFDARSNQLPRKRLARGKVERMGLATKREDRQLEVKGQVSFDTRQPDNCSAGLIVIGWRDRPPPEVMPYDEKKVIGRMSIGDRHRLASTLNFTSDAVVVPRQCEVSRQSGKVLMCRSLDGASVDPAFANVSGRYAGAMTFDMSGFDRDDPQAVLVEIPVRVARSDVRTAELPAGLLPISEVEFVAAPTPKELDEAFPWQALRAGVGADVNVGCRIQDDGSLVCVTLGVRPQAGAEQFRTDFERAAEKVVPLYRAAPKLRDGKPSAGTAFGMGIGFKVSE
jgi:hypothetical protein